MSRAVIETLIQRQLHQYNRYKSALQKAQPEQPKPERGPVVTISRMAGCNARDIAAALGERLGVQVWGRELVDQIASDAGLRRDVVALLDENLVSSVDAWVRGMLGRKLFMRDDYALTLARTIRTLAETGGAILVGRGAGFILGDQADLRIRLVASDRHRIENLQAWRELDPDAARESMHRTDAARAAFVRSYFQSEVDDPRNYDLVINSERHTLEAIVDACLRLLEARRRPLAGGSPDAPGTGPR
ncbi:MAG TPA: cytidylate kinase-like family protein [Candidatus Krumholzibacteria bacterium]|nr:cytidylate kinase-like family protein [Candidatus Krumholzibacteria bacterium]HPD72922.1 cytidylate kinase-like family protein [Candidatus Krumholzibacteria bacterium]HRY41721.1 cytidylate kinase-like family protein [Candidatus Krumholzibacteria bacterium]